MKNDKNLEELRHSFAHLLAAAVKDLYPKAKAALGPAIENGFYYDFDFGKTKISDENLPKIEGKMKELLSQWRDSKDWFKGSTASEKKAKDTFKGNKYKKELIEEIKSRKEKITLYKTGDFTDLCRGGHASKPSDLKDNAFKLTSVAGAYWRGDEKNEMLTRIYGVAFENKKDLNKHLEMLEEAKKRDHRKLGAELDLFTFSPLVGAGLPLWTPKGTILRTELQNALLEISNKYDMQPVTIPHIAKRKLYETSGHATKFGEELLKVISHYDEFVMKPVNCPHHTQIYASRPRSYKDLPLRYMESTMQYRDEKPGEIGGLTRVRAISVDDGHIFCRVDQIKDEAKNIAKIIEEFYKGLGLWGKHWVALSLRDPKNPKAYVGSDKGWKQAEKMLKEVSDELKLGAKKVEGEAAIYGPKLDYMFKDSLGREWQLATIQIDFSMPERFGLEYVNEKGVKEHPVIIHRAILGSYERFLAILIEHFAGKFPLWLSPVQARILAVSDKFQKYGEQVLKELKEAGIRAELAEANESLGKRIRQAKNDRIPYILVIGETEKKAGTVTPEHYKDGKLKEMKVSRLIKMLKEEIQNKKI